MTHPKQWFIAIVLLFLVAVSCTNTKESDSTRTAVLNQIGKDIYAIVDSINKHESLDTLISWGFAEISYQIMDDSLALDHSIEKRLRYSKLCIDNGNFEKGLKYLNGVTSTKYRFDILSLKLEAGLDNKYQFNKLYLDSLYQEVLQNYSPVKEIIYLSYIAKDLHNNFHFKEAIAQNEKIIDSMSKYNIVGYDLATIYRRLGNSYNNVYHYKNVHWSIPKDICYTKALSFYAKEKEILDRIPNVNPTRIALNNITTAMIMLEKNPLAARQLLYQALSTLVVAQDSDYIITRDPVYTTIAVSQLAENVDCKQNPCSLAEVDTLTAINQKAINQRVIRSLNSGDGMDIKVYHRWQGNQKTRNLIRVKDRIINNGKLNSLETLNISNYGKYPNLTVIPTIKNIFGNDAEKAVKAWALLHEIKFLGNLRHNNQYINFATNYLHQLDTLFKPIIASVNMRMIGNKELEQLIKYCQRNNSAILDYCILNINNQSTNGYLISNLIDSTGINTTVSLIDNVLTDDTINHLQQLIMHDSVTAYESLANMVYNATGIGNLKAKELIICADEQLEKIPFEALVTTNNKSKKWSDLCYLSNHQSIKYIPNLQVLLNSNEKIGDAQINVLFSDQDNAILPHNSDFISNLESNYRAKRNYRKNTPILHIIAHTNTDEGKRVRFILDKDTVSIFSTSFSPDLAVLHGCGSGTGLSLRSEGQLSLCRMFLYNGAKSVISSHWDADNESSVQLFSEFYTYLMAGESISRSLHKAQEGIKNNPSYPEWANPYYWANWRDMGRDLVFTQR